MYGHEKSGDQQMLIPAESGGLLLSRFRSTIGAGGLNFSVRNGKRWIPAAITTCMGFYEISVIVSAPRLLGKRH